MANENHNNVDIIIETGDEIELKSKVLRLVETDDIFKINFMPGQYIIVNNSDSGNVYFDPTNGKSLRDRIHLNPKQEIDIYIKESDKSYDYYLNLHTNPKNGDLAIIKEPVNDSVDDRKYLNHVFIYNNNDEDTNESDWCELLGSYNSSNVYLDKDFLLTANVPDDIEINPQIMEKSNGVTLLKSKGKNINEILEMIYSPEKLPTITSPKLTVNLVTKGKYLLDSIVAVNFEAIFTKGNYEFGPDTGITINNSNVEVTDSRDSTCNNVVVTEQDDHYLITGSFNSIRLNDLNETYKIRVKVSYSSGNIPKTAKGENYIDGQITTNTTIKYSDNDDIYGKILPYIEGLYIGVSENEIISSDVDINYLKTLTGTGNNYPNSIENINYKVPIGTKSIILACPSDSNGLTKIYNVTANCYMDEAFGDPYELTYTINEQEYGYKYWIYTPSDKYINETDLVITIG